MLADIWTIAWKDWKELLHMGSNVRSGLVRLLILPVGLGVLLPIQFGRAWVLDARMLLGYAWLPALAVLGVVADSFAGERERHTLETLLASRLSDRSILYGKVLVAVGYGWGVSLLTLALGLVTVNVVHGHGQLLLYPPAAGLAAAGASLMVALLAASAGVLVSLRAGTVRQAQQTLSFGFIGAMLVMYAPFYALRLLPAGWQVRLERALAHSTPSQLALAALAILIGLCGLLLAAARARFQRARLILD